MAAASLTFLVVGATGMTGRHVVQQLLEQGHLVRVIVRSKQRMLDALANLPDVKDRLLQVKEASLLDLTDGEICEQVKGTQAVICCLGHTMDFRGVFGHPRRLVTVAVNRLTTATIQVSENKQDNKQKFLLMGSNGVAHPGGRDDTRAFSDRALLTILRYLIPPHADNEEAAAYIYHSLGTSGLEWIVERPTDLVDGVAGDYILLDKPHGSLFGSGVATRATVAKSMVDLLTSKNLWDKYKFTMPVVQDVKKNDVAEETK